ncbi:Hypothetical protein CINCED_3A019468 [Cinara cedri]|uniref:HAT C-terminal dimerisation domain-containing protein n=1 Tax=Cinara cedri TaxID=506608 RepID=A0A5E4MPC0_9HEMI|nr:Hypothetical protein CINCED_3A019468 [Cinara cedri]
MKDSEVLSIGSVHWAHLLVQLVLSHNLGTLVEAIVVEVAAIPIIHYVINSSKQSRNEVVFKEVLKDWESLLIKDKTESPKRKEKTPINFNDYIFGELFDLNHDGFKIFEDLNINILSKEETICVKDNLKENNISNKDILLELYLQRKAFKVAFEMIAAVEVFGSGSAVCESTFSCLTRLENPQRQSIKHDRFSNLASLAFESERTEKLNLDALLMDFNKQKRRKLQLQ